MKGTYFKLYSLLTAAKRRTTILLLAFTIIGTLVEVLGIGLLLPVIALLVDDNLGASYPAVQPLLNALGNPTHQAQIQIIMIALIGVYLVKNLYLAFIAWWQARFSVSLLVELSQQLFSIYLRQPYNFHLQRNSAQLIRNITGEVSQFIGCVVNPTIMLVSEILVLLGIVALLLAVEPMGSMIVFLVLSTSSWLFYRSTRTRITRWGEIRQYHDGQRIQHLHQGLGGVKDVKLLGREADFLMQFNEHNSKSGQMALFLQILQALPRLWLELLAVVGFALLVLIMLDQGQGMSSILPTVGLFAAAAFRLLPSVNRILINSQSLRYGLPAINSLYEDFQLQVPESETGTKSIGKSAGLQEAIRFVDITYNYPDASTSALIDISINIQQGEFVGFIGPSGSGKSTLVDVIMGLLTPDSGQVIVDGQDIQQNIRIWQDQIGYVPQAIYLTDDTLRRNIAFGLPADQIDDEAVKRAIQAAQLEEFVAGLPDEIETVVGERGVRLSGGQRQRIGVARALYHDPCVLVLDEATSALDSATEEGVMRAAMALHGSKTVIVVAHRLTTVEHCDRLYRMDQGRVVEHGTPFEVISPTKITSSN
jgi:ABC-type multidrug transport system fused ATPase/permease subunit